MNSRKNSVESFKTNPINIVISSNIDKERKLVNFVLENLKHENKTIHLDLNNNMAI